MRKNSFPKLALCSVATLLVSTSLVSCATSVDYWSESQTADDSLPASVPADSFDQASTRFLATAGDENSFYVAKNSADETCLVLVPADPSAWVSGCSRNLPVQVSSKGTTGILEGSLEPSGDYAGFIEVVDGLWVRTE